MKSTKILLSVVMALAMMMLCPQTMWADDAQDYLCFRVSGCGLYTEYAAIHLDSVGTQWGSAAPKLEYSEDKTHWSEYKYKGDPIQVSSYYASEYYAYLYFRVKSSNSTFSQDADNYLQFKVTTAGNNVSVSVCGNVMSLLSPDCSATTVSRYAFVNLFNGCPITSAPQLPATTLGEHCYDKMFYGCTSLTEAPLLPATTLSTGCYESMFEGCSNLSQLAVCFSDWTNGTTTASCTTDWVKGTASTGTFACPKALDISRTASAVPSGWQVMNSDPLCFTAEEATTLSLTDNNNASSQPAIVYAKEGTAWADYTFGTAVTLAQGEKVRFRAKDTNSTFNGSEETSPCIQLKSTGKVAASGNMMSLLDKSCLKTEVPNDAFSSFFYQCTTLTKAPELPATTLHDGCYKNMFYGCTALTAAPALPAFTLAAYCYTNMFYGCSSLLSTPVLPATTLASHCYESMFCECTKLSTAVANFTSWDGYSTFAWLYHTASRGMLICPDALDTSHSGPTTYPDGWSVQRLAPLCFSALNSNGPEVGFTVEGTMTNLPSLQYSTDGKSWKEYTFDTKVKLSSYGSKVYFRAASRNNAFSKDINNYIHFVSTGDVDASGSVMSLISSDGCTTEVPSSAFIRLFSGCTTLYQAPELSAITLSDSCYYEMFKGCTALYSKTGIVLPARTLKPHCYHGMYNGCTSVCNITVNFIDWSVSGATTDWLNGTKADGIFYCPSELDASERGAYRVPGIWTVERLRPLCFTAKEVATVSFEAGLVDHAPNPLPSLVYSYDNLTWNNYYIDQEITLTPGEKIYFRATSTNSSFNQYGGSVAAYVRFRSTGKVAASGRIMSLLDMRGAGKEVPQGAFYSLFSDCSNLTSAPELTATSVGQYGYYYMFSGCTGLTEAPVIPAATVGANAYGGMFGGCYNLNKVVTKFTSWKSTDDLATTYSWLKGVASTGTFICSDDLDISTRDESTVPEGWTVQHPDYLCFTAGEAASEVNFSVTGTLTSTPGLQYSQDRKTWQNYTFGNAVTLAAQGDKVYFRAKDSNESFSEGSQKCITFSSTKKVAASGSIMSLLDNFCLQDSVPRYAFYKLFSGCTNLTAAPVLSASKLSPYCYEELFSGCTNINSVTVGFSAWTPATATIDWLKGVATDGVFCCPAGLDVTTRSSTTVPMSWAVNPDYLCFTSAEDNTDIAFAKSSDAYSPRIALQYSTDNKSWQTYSLGHVVTIEQAGGKVYFRAKSVSDPFYNDDSNYIHFTATKNVAASGNIMSLMDGLTPVTTVSENEFRNLFKDCQHLTTAPKLSATTLASGCYQSMFSGCTALTAAPALEAPTLAAHCYDSMFDGCTALATAPELRDTTLAESCYASMFKGCTSLTTAPYLYAKTLAPGCYASMFSGCASLKEVSVNFTRWYPQSSTEVATSDWLSGVAATGTFYHSKGLDVSSKGASAVPSGWTTACLDYLCFTAAQENIDVAFTDHRSKTADEVNLVYSIDDGMTWQTYHFRSNIRLSKVGDKVYFRAKDKNSTFSENFETYEVISFKSTGKVCASGNIMSLLDKTCQQTTVPTYAFSGLFMDIYGESSGYDNLLTAPELPATTLSAGCYESMFCGCLALTTAPKLPASTLAPYCYRQMFYKANVLNHVEACFTDWDVADNATTEWLAEVASTGDFYYAEGLDVTKSSSSTVPSGWTSTIPSYLCFTAEEDGTQVDFAVQGVMTRKPTLQYSLDKTTWSDYEPGSGKVTLAKSGDKVYFKATSSNATFSQDIQNYIYFEADKKVAASGSVMSLLDATSKQNSLPANAFCGLFHNCANLTSAPELPATTLAQNCYREMFSGCTSITIAPRLPATTLTNGCYESMFAGCTTLGKVSVSFSDWNTSGEATKNWLDNVADNGRFIYNQGLNVSLRSVSTVPEGWTVVIPDGCLNFTAYEEDASVTLSVQGVLSATPKLEFSRDAVAWSDYTVGSTINLGKGEQVWFRAVDGDNATFSHDASNYLYFSTVGMVSARGSVMSLFDNTCLRDSVPEYAFCKLFSGCASLIAAPNVPAKKIAAHCYDSMFSGCTSLTVAPELPADKLEESCYASMFKGCSALSSVIVNFSNWESAETPTVDWLADVASTGTFLCPNELDVTTITFGPSTIPVGWTVKNPEYLCFTAQEATEVAFSKIERQGQWTYQLPNLMYSTDRTNWSRYTLGTPVPLAQDAKVYFRADGNNATFCESEWCRVTFSSTGKVAASGSVMSLLDRSCQQDTVPEYAFCGLFYDCNTLTTAPLIPATKLSKCCYYIMFKGCTALTTAPQLPATTLVTGCYECMFAQCTSLTESPYLHATTLAPLCYLMMFDDCKNLKKVTVNFSDWGSDNDKSTRNWLSDVSATGTLVCPSSLNVTTRDASHVPAGWTVSTDVPTALPSLSSRPAPTLKNGKYLRGGRLIIKMDDKSYDTSGQLLRNE